MSTKRLVVLIAVFLYLAVSNALAHGNGQAKGKGKGKDKRKEDAAAVTATATATVTAQFGGTFSSEERNVIRDWFSREENLQGLPPGLAKRDELPPGLEKQLRKNGTLSPGLERKLTPLPPELESRLPQIPEDVGRVILEGRVILMNRTTNRILDIIEDIFPD